MASGSNQSFNYVNDYDSVESAAHPYAEYDRMSRTVLPMFAVFMPVADARRTTSMDFAVSVMSCLGIKHFIQGSRVPAAAPRSIDVASEGGRLSGEEVAGIVVGSVVGATIVGAVLNLYRVRAARTYGVSVDGVANESQQIEMLVLAEADSGGALQEVGSDDACGFELPDETEVEFAELAGCTSNATEVEPWLNLPR
jgi:hypothetical protein